MWNNNNQPGYGGAPPPFPTYQSRDGPQNNYGPQPGFHPGYAPAYGPPGGGYGPPPGPPPGGYAPSGPPPSGYAPPPGPPSGYGPHHGGFAPPPGPPPQGYGPPPGPPQLPRYAPPSGPPPQCGYPGQQHHQQQPNNGYPGQQHHQQQPNNGYPGQQYHQQQPNNGYPGQYSAQGANVFHPQGPPPMPPSQVQKYGPHFQGQNNQDAQPWFQYSLCNGKKKGLFVGINYVGQDGQLAGCINDVHNIKAFVIERFGYKQQDLVTLTDDQTNPRSLPTRANIIQAIQWLVRDAQPNDSLFFHYSGHGGQTKDLDGDEADGFDEVIYPLDFEAAGHISDDDMHDLLVKSLPPGCRLTAIFDSCHSGSALDLPYVYSTEGKLKEPNLASEAGQGLLKAVTSYAKGDMGGVFKSAMGLVKTAAGNSQKADKFAKATKTSPADVISFSGCKDSQTSADTQEAGEATGAMSFALISALRSNPQQSYQELLVNVREILKSKYSQKPQLSSSHPIDTNIMFIC